MRKDPKWREAHRAYKRDYYRRTSEAKKKYARRLADKIPLTECAMCFSKKDLERHHPDYNKPKEVVIMCAPCHKKWHRALGVKYIRKQIPF